MDVEMNTEEERPQSIQSENTDTDTDSNKEGGIGCEGCQSTESQSQPKKHIPRSQKKKIARLKKKERMKELRKEKKVLKRQKENNRQESDESKVKAAGDSEGRVSKRQRLQEIRDRLDEGLRSGQKIAVDLSMEHLMSEKECNKLAQQINRVYGANKQLPHPAHLYLTGLKPDGNMCRELHNKCAGFENYKIDVCNPSHLEVFKPNEVVYLSPDAENVLQSVDPDKVYIIGGLVDEHIQKGVTQSRAEEHKVYSARLPIDEFLTKSEQGTYNKVLAINQVFEILMKYTECQDWVESLQVGMAKRWGYVPKRSCDTETEAASSTAAGQSATPTDS